MRRSVHLSLLILYYYCQLLGLLRFNWDFRTGYVYTTTFNTVYSIVVNVLMFGSVPFVYNLEFFKMVTQIAHDLQRWVYLIMAALRIFAVFVTLIINWRKRQVFINVINCFNRLRRVYFYRLPVRAAVLTQFENAIIWKLIFGFINELTSVLMILTALHNALNWHVYWRLIVLFFLYNMLSVLVLQFYFAMVTVTLHYSTLNDELDRILRQMNAVSVQRQQRPGYYSVYCCQLADELDILARVQSQLQELMMNINEIYGLQNACYAMAMYANDIGAMYMLYMLYKHSSKVNMSTLGLGLMIVALSANFLEGRCVLMAWANLLSAFKKTSELLRRHLNMQLVDARLERTIEQFCNQITMNPLKLSSMGLFDVNLQAIFGVMSSMVSHSIVLMQMDYKYKD